MDRAGTNSECRARRGALVAVFVLFELVFNPAMPAESDDPAARGALEVTSDLRRPLYALPDDQAVIEARANLQADPTSVDRARSSSLPGGVAAIPGGSCDRHAGPGPDAPQRRPQPGTW
jgi:hypothetical protein